MPNVSDLAPDFTLPDTKKAPTTLSSFHGKRVLLAFYPGAFTGVCTKEMCTLRDSLSAFEGLGVQVLGVSVDSPFANGGFAEKNGLTFPLLSDYDRKVTKAWGVELNNFAGLPGYVASQRAVFIVGADGKVAWKWVAETPGTEPPYDQIRAFLG